MISSFGLYRRAVGYPGIASAFAHRLSGTTTVRAVAAPGCRHPVHLRVPSSDPYVFDQVFGELEYDFETATEPNVIVDAGANIGLASVYFANRYPNATIVAVEPEAGNAALLRRNVAPYPNVRTLEAAVWSDDGTIDLVDTGLGDWGFVTREAADGPAAPNATVPAYTIDTLMKMFDLPAIDVLKMDIEGAELEVFRDASSWIDRVGALIVELHERTKPGCNRSFYAGTAGFANEWARGENVYLARADGIGMRPAVAAGR